MTIKQLEKRGLHIDTGPLWELDVVCGMEVDAHTAHHHREYNGTTYYFCNANCLQHFTDSPQRYVG